MICPLVLRNGAARRRARPGELSVGPAPDSQGTRAGRAWSSRSRPPAFPAARRPIFCACPAHLTAPPPRPGATAPAAACRRAATRPPRTLAAGPAREARPRMRPLCIRGAPGVARLARPAGPSACRPDRTPRAGGDGPGPRRGRAQNQHLGSTGGYAESFLAEAKRCASRAGKHVDRRMSVSREFCPGGPMRDEPRPGTCPGIMPDPRGFPVCRN